MARTVVITGASGGIGRALAIEYAGAGTTFGLLGRDPQRLEEVAEACRGRGATVETGLLDVRDAERLTDWLHSFDRRHPVDLLIVNAGVQTGVDAQGTIEPLASAQRTIDVNLTGAVRTAAALLDRMQQRRTGHVAFVSSLAGLVPQPHMPAYSASKAGLVSYGTALGVWLRSSGVTISVVCPGYVASAMSRRHRGANHFAWPADRAAGYIRRRLDRKRPLVAFPWQLALGIRLMALAPSPLYRWIVGRLAATVEPDPEGEREIADDRG
ncbi:MAG: SDR family NAD(P)-dependent oxidoreductase [Alphaproteobacteria bacterium]|nr:SDR family NAD(P)-dependent oxidoreductase [Alphaproteobacteria bacterium]